MKFFNFFGLNKCINGIDEIRVHGKIHWNAISVLNPLFSQFDNPFSWYFVCLTLISRKNANISGQTSRNHLEATLHSMLEKF